MAAVNTKKRSREEDRAPIDSNEEASSDRDRPQFDAHKYSNTVSAELKNDLTKLQKFCANHKITKILNMFSNNNTEGELLILSIKKLEDMGLGQFCADLRIIETKENEQGIEKSKKPKRRLKKRCGNETRRLFFEKLFTELLKGCLSLSYDHSFVKYYLGTAYTPLWDYEDPFDRTIILMIRVLIESGRPELDDCSGLTLREIVDEMAKKEKEENASPGLTHGLVPGNRNCNRIGEIAREQLGPTKYGKRKLADFNNPYRVYCGSEIKVVQDIIREHSRTDEFVAETFWFSAEAELV